MNHAEVAPVHNPKPAAWPAAWQTYRRLLNYLRPHRGVFALGVLGEARLQLWRLGGGMSSRTSGAVLQAVMDPLGELERWAGTPC